MKKNVSVLEMNLADPALSESELRYQRLLSATSDYIYSVVFNQGITTTTHGPGCEAVTGYTTSEFANDSYLWYRVIHDEDRAAVMARIDLILNDKSPATPIEHRIIHKNGSVRWIRNTTIPHRNKLGQLLGYDGLISDITERKAIEQTLHETNVFLDSVVENIPIGVFIKRASDLRFVRINRSEETLLRCSRDEIIGRTDYDLFPRSEADFFTAKDREVLASGRLLDIPEEPIKVKDGSVRIIHTMKIPVRNEYGQPTFLLGISEDITERKQVEQALRESEARVRIATQAAGIAVWDWNLKTNAIKWDEKMFTVYGLPPTPAGWVTYEDWVARVLPSDLAAQVAELQRTVATCGQSQREFRIRRASDQATRVIQAAEMAVPGSDGQAARVVGMNIDITERKLAEAELQSANAKLLQRGEVLKSLVRQLRASHRQLKETQLELIQAEKLESLGTLAAGVAHEMKNPLQTVLLGLDYLGSRLQSPDENIAVTLDEMRDAVKRASIIIREMLTLSKYSDFSFVPQDLNALLNRTLLLLKNSLVTAQIQLVLELAPDLPPLSLDPPKLEQVFLNVFINSLQAMTAGGTLTVRSRPLTLDETTAREPVFRKFSPGSPLVVVEVQDTGSGLTAEAINRAFDPFFTTKPVGVGTGLGLSVTRKIVDAHGGNIEIKNAPGGGALVVVVLKA